MELKQCFLTNNGCYIANKKMKPIGIVVHDTGAGNPNLCRYVQPDDGKLGVNKYKNDWNRSGINKCVNAMIGKDKNGVVRTYQTLPFDVCPWGCGSGAKGSYNNSHIQFEILDDKYVSKEYFEAAFKQAIELCAYLCKKYEISIENIVSHKEAYKLGYATNHGDCDGWLKKFGKDMKWFRSEVQKKITEMTPVVTPTTKVDEKYTMEYLKKGSNNNDVTVFEILLKKMGFYSSTIDKDYGSKCVEACKAFQKKYGLTVDGECGSQTWKKIFELRK